MMKLAQVIITHLCALILIYLLFALYETTFALGARFAQASYTTQELSVLKSFSTVILDTTTNWTSWLITRLQSSIYQCHLSILDAVLRLGPITTTCILAALHIPYLLALDRILNNSSNPADSAAQRKLQESAQRLAELGQKVEESRRRVDEAERRLREAERRVAEARRGMVEAAGQAAAARLAAPERERWLASWRREWYVEYLADLAERIEGWCRDEWCRMSYLRRFLQCERWSTDAQSHIWYWWRVSGSRQRQKARQWEEVTLE